MRVPFPGGYCGGCGRARVRKWAYAAVRFARVADGASVKNQTVTEVGPLLRRETGGDLPFDGHWIGIGMPPVAAPTQPSGHAHHMSVYRKAGNMEGIAQHHIRGFPPHAGQAGQLIHGARHFAVEATGQHLSQSQQMLGLRAVEPKRANNAFHVLGIGAGQIRTARISGKQFGRDRIDPFVSGLSAEHSGDQQLQRGFEMQRAFGLGVGAAQYGIFRMHAFQTGLTGFPSCGRGGVRGLGYHYSAIHRLEAPPFLPRTPRTAHPAGRNGSPHCARYR